LLESPSPNPSDLLLGSSCTCFPIVVRILLPIGQFLYLFARPWRQGVVCLDGPCGIIAETKARFRSPSMRQNPSLACPRNASRRLSGLVGWWRGLPVKGLARD